MNRNGVLQDGQRDPAAGTTLRSGAFVGAAAWLAYGLLESLLITVAPAVRQRFASLRPDWFVDRGGSIGDLAVALPALAVYAVIGAIAGTLTAVVLRTTVPGRPRLSGPGSGVAWRDLATLSVVSAFGLHAGHVHEWAAVTASLIAASMTAVDLLAARRPSSNRHWCAPTHPGTALVVLLAASFMGELGASHSWLGRSGVAAAAALTIIALAAALDVVARLWARVLGPGRLGRLSAVGIVLIAALALLGTSSVPPRGYTRDLRPNVILVTLDTVRADHLSVYGYGRDTTPNLNRLPATVYQRAVAASNWTLPSHASIMTGQSPRRHGAHNRRGGVAESHPIGAMSVTMAELLSASGYRTAAVIANTAHLLPEYGVVRGFDSYEYVRPSFVPGPRDPRYLLCSAVRGAVARSLGESARFAAADRVNESAGRVLGAEARSGRPLFLWLNYMDAHVPYVPPSPFDARYPGKARPFDWSSFPALVEQVSIRHERSLTAAETAHLVSQYDGAIAYLDDRLQRLFDELKGRGLYDNSLIIITADHGEGLGDASIVSHGMSVYQSQVWVPLVVKYPGAAARESVKATASAVDILPTVLDVVGARPLEQSEGRSLRAAGSRGSEWITSESYSPRGPGFTSADDRPDEMALFAGRWKLIVGAGGGTELYDLRADPRETHNLAGRRAISAEWLTEIRTAMDEAGDGSGEQSPPIDPETVQRLRALGYLR
jgi:arylsulfatase A-like enzyme